MEFDGLVSKDAKIESVQYDNIITSDPDQIENAILDGLDSPFIQDEVEAAIKDQVKPILTTLFNDILENPHHITTEFTEAFDSISHDSIKRTLIHIGIPIKLINLIHKLLSDSLAKISINGKTTRKFDIIRGVKQGDPISATLFVIYYGKTSGTTLKTKTTIINTYSLSPITYLSYLEEFTKDEEIQINKLISWFMNSPANSESPTLNTNSIENNTSTTTN
ncbi:hypothetical protein DDB_G0268724 [Dictyostelium discoideum AX4]|uniref:Reverse transcriptase domain-containing protein n=1 Tax=Dictyostelium discoideum TaxID=44689 RepID=Q55EX0_DICDI|nr:hypothetical protein DDB_G0268724 [Dictyostelium discoideum AX4]EAL72951.1 hypothetical protein DDB_G0268724 [Dictyostelium discoideum AX4]|eukprot:XP_646900.1 hypothetical protein DDB_G0268724 [Dictyostelium discoideum AX4]